MRRFSRGHEAISPRLHPLKKRGGCIFNVLKTCRHGLMAYSRNDVYIGRSLDLYGEASDPWNRPSIPHSGASGSRTMTLDARAPGSGPEGQALPVWEADR